jgi:RNA polymerase sigma-70 factor, ECF subfamily
VRQARLVATLGDWTYTVRDTNPEGAFVAVPEESKVQLEEDLGLIQRCLEGDEEGYEELVSRFQGMVYNLAYRFMGSPQEAEDLTQEVFLKIFRSLKSFRGASTLKTWIYRITTNMALNRLKFQRRRKRHRQVSIDQEMGQDLPPMSESLPDERPGPERQAHSTEITRRLQEALDSISADQKAAVILRDVEGLTYEEIAEALDINIGTVKSRLARGRSNIQEIMKDML